MATEAQPAKQAKLLIVEDDVMIRVVLADMLCELGYTVAAEAASIDEALEATRKTDPEEAVPDRRAKAHAARAPWDRVITSGLPRVGTARRERGRRKFCDPLLMASSSSARGTTGSAPLPAKILPPPRNKIASVVFTT